MNGIDLLKLMEDFNRKPMRVLVACEESQEVCKAFRALGHEAYSADIQEPSGGHPEWHILGDVLPIINGECMFVTMDGKQHCVNGVLENQKQPEV